ncbi:hypothetical protein L596_010319 [Steinernema carpocapsae]|uniref:C-type lectin domain-containing protein n=1 Tax=Steinernema carpocapsae TaxID=34508 RepID=A0A4U5PIG0_STECR|nr:hypothetical protein L596_010319 [Steinernema carpocapsae]
MKLLLPLLFVFGLLNPGVACPPNAHYSSDGSKCYHLVKRPMSYSEAKEICGFFGGRLVPVGDVRGFEEENFWAEAKTSIGLCAYVENQNVGYQDCSEKLPFLCQTEASLFPSTDTTCTCPDPVACATCPPPTTCPESPACPTPTPASCPPNWTRFQDHCYTVLGVANFFESGMNCVNQGGRLESVHSQEENDFIGALLLGSDKVGSWIGGYRSSPKDSFGWSDATPWNYTFWDKNQPTDKKNENCVWMLEDYPKTFRWENINCYSFVQSAVCKRNLD